MLEFVRLFGNAGLAWHGCSKAAELLGLHELELRERFLELGIPLRLGPADLAEARAEVEAVRAWYGRASEEQPA